MLPELLLLLPDARGRVIEGPLQLDELRLVLQGGHAHTKLLWQGCLLEVCHGTQSSRR